MNTNRLSSDVKGFFKDKINKIFVLLLLFGSLNSGLIVYYGNIIHKSVIKSEKKTDFRYFNLTRSLEDIYNVEIDTKDGKVRKFR